MKQVTLGDLVEEVELKIEPITKEFGISLKYKYSEKILSNAILVDLSMLMQALEAVVVNACESYQKSDDRKVVTMKWL